ncbi:MAG: RedB protein [Opitutaceae bacterium]
MSPLKLIGLGAGVALWAVGIAVGFAALQRHSAIPGTTHTPSASADAFFRVHRQPGRSLLVMAVHPLCPCTDASLAELGDLLARSRGTCDALLLQYHPARGTPDWPVDPSPRHLGGVSVPILLDRDGQIASALGAETSGHAVFVDAGGTVRFHGGLTIARGHRGRSPAQDAVLDTLGGRPTKLTSAPVFGCSLGPECRPDAKP